MTETEFESYVESLSKYVQFDPSVQNRKLLERETAALTDKEAAIFVGALEIEQPKDMNEIITILQRLSNYRICRGIANPDELGRELVSSGEIAIPKEALPFIDYSLVAAKYESANKGVYTDGDFVYKVRDGEEECRIENIDINIESIPEISLQSNEINALNELTHAVFELHKTASHADTFMAAVEAEGTKTILDIADMIEIADNISRYKLMPSNIGNAYEYGEYILYDSNTFNPRDPDSFAEFSDEVKDYIDYEEYGKYRMKEDGVCETTYGLISRSDRMLPQAEETQNSGMSMV